MDLRTQLSNTLKSHLKLYFPQALQLVGDELTTALATDLLLQWPTLQQLQRAQANTVHRFYHVHHVRSATVIETRLARIESSVPLSDDTALLKPAVPDTSWSTRDDWLFEQWRVDLEVPSTDVNQVVLLELEARIRRLARSRAISSDKETANDLTPAIHDRSFDKVEQMAVYITENYQEQITTSDIAAAGLHPKYAMTLFRDRCGLAIGEYLAQQRISQAQRLLATTEKKIVDIAFTSGFGSVSQFYDVFTRHCHQSPQDFRRRQKQYYGGDGGKVVLSD